MSMEKKSASRLGCKTSRRYNRIRYLKTETILKENNLYKTYISQNNLYTTYISNMIFNSQLRKQTISNHKMQESYCTYYITISTILTHQAPFPIISNRLCLFPLPLRLGSTFHNSRLLEQHKATPLHFLHFYSIPNRPAPPKLQSMEARTILGSAVNRDHNLVPKIFPNLIAQRFPNNVLFLNSHFLPFCGPPFFLRLHDKALMLYTPLKSNY
ncbi:uncharacterized protein DS421_4g108030 [Arachis hypogaea]|nr:uncharacterized protein DS421_4g108030 [Arachis hypogaea]